MIGIIVKRTIKIMKIIRKIQLNKIRVYTYLWKVMPGYAKNIVLKKLLDIIDLLQKDLNILKTIETNYTCI